MAYSGSQGVCVLTRFEQLPKGMKREIRQLAGAMHERLLAAELCKLDGEFARWRRKELDAFELAAAVHRFHEGPPRRLLNTFNTNHIEVLIFKVREGLERGLLREEEISEEVIELLAALPVF